MNHGLNCFFNAHAIGTGLVAGSGETYRFRSTMSEGMAFAFMAYEKSWKDYDNYPVEWHKKMFSQFMRVREFYSGDYYPLLAQTPDPQAWCAYEFWREDLNSGIAAFFRREESPFSSGDFQLFIPDLNENYKIENVDTGETSIISGRTLTEGKGYSLTLAPRESCLILIQKGGEG